ncbi:hypothetical protein MPTK1_6g03610 [Marchantia polymorpha subsp. ruderalis]|uniref:Uncharacterized protein n=2 Tax=Marchantia polymorpha TaxID=3197 RepID=A0A176WDB2_MARPO|nr:hypothetical protein AXG93_4031s1090 [Marchantia polymorpha subsp. ruderalis]PTQ41374.1 hypothetical protein MARPO_0035s0140 [Marchantia polymorpha]BBN13454.1 hypothetical protein Mp_6g03610 [Marchantia polymorpha subsp. ruderalis]|eukprot:PTQ41374.1 hypothetical protein MARPO_0035s0140 [Marchantia polymorpha]
MENSIWNIQKFQRGARAAGVYLLFSGITFFYVNLSTRAGVPRTANPYSAYPAGTDLLFDATKLYKSALSNIFEDEEWGPLEFGIMAKHYEREGKAPYSYHSMYMEHILSNGKMTSPNL